jgi:GNAT superfamily N-acetyltransferase
VYGERIGVLPAYRGRGIAAALTKAIEASASERRVSQVHVKVRASIPSNLRVYEKLGYRVLDSKPYPIGTDVEITLAKDLLIHENRLRFFAAVLSGIGIPPAFAHPIRLSRSKSSCRSRPAASPTCMRG